MSTPSQALAAVRQYLRRRGGGVVLLSLLGAGAAVLVVAWLLGGGGWEAGSPLPLLLLILGGLGALLAVAGVVARLRRWTSEEEVAGEMERQARLPRGTVRAQLELDRSNSEGVSSSLVRAGSRALMDRLSSTPERLSGQPGQELSRLLRGTAGITALLAAVVVLLLVLSPDRSRTAWAGLAAPGAILTGSALPALELDPGDAHVPRGSRPQIQVQATRRSQVTLHWQAVGEPLREEVLVVEDGLAQSRLPAVEGTVRYWASAPDGARTPDARLEPSDPLLLAELALELEYPEHTRIPPEVMQGTPISLSIPRGTRVGIRGRMEGRGDGRVVLRGEEGGALFHLEAQDGELRGTWVPERSDRIHWEVDSVEDEALLPPAFDLELEEDLPPEIALPVPGRDTEIPASLTLPLLVEASDDYGLERVEIHLSPVGDASLPEGIRVQVIPVDGERALQLRPTLDLAGRELRPGDELLLSARAVDNSLTGQESWTPEYRLRVPSAVAQRDAAREHIEEMGERVGALSERAGQEARQLQDRAMDSRTQGSDGEASFEDREALREAAQGHEAMGDEVDELREELEDARMALEGLGDEDGGLGERLERLESLLREVADPEELERVQDLLSRLEAGETPDLAEEFSQLAEARESLEERLDAAMERIQREALEEAFQGSEEELRGMVEEQETLAESEALSTPEGAQEQERVAERAQEVQDRLEELARRLEDQGDMEAAQRAADASADMAEARESMQEAVDAAMDGDGEAAGEAADEAAQAAREALQEMEEARMEWLEEWEEVIREALRRGAEDALSLARRQDDLQDRIQGTGTTGRRAMQSEEAAIVQGIRNLATRISLATRQAPSVGREVNAALGEAMVEAERTVEELGRGGLGAAERSAYAAAGRSSRALSQAALLALAGMERVGETPDGSAMDDLLQELDALADQQEAINQEAEALSGEPDADGAAARMEEMAAAQEAVAGGVEELADMSGGEWTPGDLDEMAREARELAEALAEGRLEPEIRERQTELLERFLGAGRTLERDGPTEEREGTTAEEVDRPLIAPLSQDLLQGHRVPLPSAAELDGLTPAERRLVLEYFERLNRWRGEGWQP